MPIQYRRDDERKVQADAWGISTDFSSIFLTARRTPFSNATAEPVMEQLLYNHPALHKEDTNPQVRKLVISVTEYLGADVVMEFDLPDSIEIADSCGLILHKK